MEAQGKIEIIDLDIDKDFQIMNDLFSTEKDEEIPLVLEEETYCIDSNLVGEKLLSRPKLVFMNKENVQRVVNVKSKEVKVAGRSKNRNSDDISSYSECEKCSKKYKSDVNLTYLCQDPLNTLLI